MFAKLTGSVDTIMTDSLILDVGGVGYHVFASNRTLSALGVSGGASGTPASLLIETHVREDHIHLYGFLSLSERDWFRILTSVQGVGAKSGLAILSVASPDQLMVAIAAQDTNLFRQADGVGPKLATRIVTELKDKVQNLKLTPSSHMKDAGGTNSKLTSLKSDNNQNGAVDQDAVSALINLGYGRSEAFTAVMNAKQKAMNDNIQTGVEVLIRLALKELSS